MFSFEQRSCPLDDSRSCRWRSQSALLMFHCVSDPSDIAGTVSKRHGASVWQFWRRCGILSAASYYSTLPLGSPGIVQSSRSYCRLTTAASSLTPTPEDCARLTPAHLLLVGRTSTSVTENVTSEDNKSGTMCHLIRASLVKSRFRQLLKMHLFGK